MNTPKQEVLKKSAQDWRQITYQTAIHPAPAI